MSLEVFFKSLNYIFVYISTCRISVQPDQHPFSPVKVSMSVNDSDSYGSEFEFVITIRNNGPSRSPFSTLTVYWPYEDPMNPDYFFLVPTLPTRDDLVS